METTVGRILLDEALPPEMRDPQRKFDAAGVKALFTELAHKDPQAYVDVNLKLNRLAAEVSSKYGRTASLSLNDLRTPDSIKKMRLAVKDEIEKIQDEPIKNEEKEKKISHLLSSKLEDFAKVNYEDGLANNNAFAGQILSGARGNKIQFMSLRVGDIMVSDHKDRPIPVPILSSYAEGLDPVQYFAGSYGARRGVLSSKLSVPKAGFLGKQLFQAAHRIVVTEKDCGTKNGMPVHADDTDNEGAVLAQDFGGMKAGTVLTPKGLMGQHGKKLVVRSPITCQAENGICQICAGQRDNGFPSIGSNVGAQSSQAVSEPLAQSGLSQKHTGGVGKSSRGGLEFISKFVQAPEHFIETVPSASTDGSVTGIEDAPQGGKFVFVGEEKHWVPADQTVSVKKGDTVEAGDALAEGLAHPALVVQHKGIGEGRRYFVDQFRKIMQNSGVHAHRRNIEVLARGLVNHVRVTDLDGPADTVPDDIVEYDSIARGYQPRFGSKRVAPKDALGLYLEKPTLHYSIGTRVTPKVVGELKDYGISEVEAHKDHPSFAPEHVRAMENLTHSDDWMTRLGGFYLQRGFLDAARRGSDAKMHGTSFIPPLAQGTEFGKVPPGKGY